MAVQRAEWERLNPDKKAAYNRKSKLKCSERVAKNEEKWSALKKQMRAEGKYKPPCESPERRRERYHADVERSRGYQIKYRNRHLEKVREKEALYIRSHPDVAKAKNSARRARLRAAEGKFSAADVRALGAKQSGKCFWCQSPMEKYHIDHVIPLSRGGTNYPENIVLACAPCNLAKHSKMPDEWAREMAKRGAI